MNKPEIIDRALGYPYDIRDSSFILHKGRTVGFDPAATADRHPVIAAGSNRAPQQLKRKFGDNETIPVEHARLHDHDVVHSAHLSTYGAVPATLRHVASTAVHVGITWLTSAQLDVMHLSELPNGNYDFVQLTNIRLETEQGETLAEVFSYQSRRGHLAGPADEALALAEVKADGRRLSAFTQRQALDHARCMVAADHNLHAFVHSTVADHDKRRARIRALQQSSVDPAHWPHVEIIAPGYENS